MPRNKTSRFLAPALLGAVLTAAGLAVLESGDPLDPFATGPLPAAPFPLDPGLGADSFFSTPFGMGNSTAAGSEGYVYIPSSGGGAGTSASYGF